MTRWFNVAGPCKADIHYMLPPTARLPELPRLIAQQTYFVLHAPRQTGKTTAMLALARELTASGNYIAAVLSVEVGAAFNDDIAAAEDAILSEWRGAVGWQLPASLQPASWNDAAPGARISTVLREWAQQSTLPLVVLIDEIDALRNDALISVLRQIRAGYPARPQSFPQSLGLIGLRDVRDYKVASGGSDRLHTASPFNIKTESITLRTFTAAEVAQLYAQHTADTGQLFTPAAVDLAFDLTQGQPWLVNALARQAVEFIEPDLSQPITPTIILEAKERLIVQRATHLDSLAERLREDRVRQVIGPILGGGSLGDVSEDDIRFVQDLGLARRDGAGGLVIANPIYREVIPRVLATTPEASLPYITPAWLRADGTLDLVVLRDAFLAFWREHGEALLGAPPRSYPEIAPHLVLMAFLHRIVNGHGTLVREYAIGRDRMELLLSYGAVRLAIELKVWRTGRTNPQAAELTQLDAYLDRLGLATGWLVIFDTRADQPPIAERTTTASAITPAGRSITLIWA